jgi:hypothetical protein
MVLGSISDPGCFIPDLRSESEEGDSKKNASPTKIA